jgi:hypothetical protein
MASGVPRGHRQRFACTAQHGDRSSRSTASSHSFTGAIRSAATIVHQRGGAVGAFGRRGGSFRSRTRRVALQIVAATLLCGFAATKGRAKRAPGDGWRREWDSSPRRRAKRVGSCLKPAQLRLTSRSEVGGESGIRTHGRVSPTHAFQACLIDRSSISPFRINDLRHRLKDDCGDCDTTRNLAQSLTVVPV